MAYLPTSLPAVQPTLDDRAFWQHCNAQSLRFQACSDCGAFRHPPMPICPHCHSERHEWRAASGPMRVFTYTWVHHPAHPEVRGSLPYNVVLVQFPACGGVKLVSNVIDATPQTLQVGTELELVWEAGAAEQMLPRFRLKR
ncbi:Zn-ribbon domain-containing OB-fold protein [Ferrovibrio sp.]|uniref:Zn-ribbon domain-containing OB-fold protein n=1 Tax=Ferrovibrio sp. TaxID=1917215 RepID=UPI003D2BFBAF